ncbi:hypothetical protein [Methanobrevibacter sp.]|uniref:hypothetical protein n=1 Tax=Methanobrevibacter sp. TaxID=66852 RepID=UPI00388EA604
MNKKYVLILVIVAIIGVILLIYGMNSNVDKQINNDTNITSNNVTINVTHIGNNSDESSSNDGGQSSDGRYREVRDEEYLGDAVVYEDTYTGKYYYQGQEMDYASLADEYNREHGVGPYAE